MQFLRILTVVGMFLSLISGAKADVLSFKEWKNEKVSGVRQQYSLLETQYLTKKETNPQDRTLGALYKELKSSKSHLDELQDLTVTDYFISYLTQFKDKKSVFQAAVNKLEPTEISELMTAYADSLLKTSGEGLSTVVGSDKLEASK